MSDTNKIVHILNTHFPTNWSNENLRERVIEFGEDVWRQAIAAAAGDITLAQKVAKFLNQELRFPPTLCNKALDVMRSGIPEAAWDLESVFNEFEEHSD